MTVAELIEELRGMPQDSIVLIPGYQYGYHTVNHVDPRRAMTLYNCHTEYGGPLGLVSHRSPDEDEAAQYENVASVVFSHRDRKDCSGCDGS